MPPVSRNSRKRPRPSRPSPLRKKPKTHAHNTHNLSFRAAAAGRQSEKSAFRFSVPSAYRPLAARNPSLVIYSSPMAENSHEKTLAALGVTQPEQVVPLFAQLQTQATA